MKKLLKKSLIFLMLMVMMPLASFLVACGATPGNSVKGVAFVSDIYDEETGKAIFEVDLNVATELTYKCNPSTASGKIDYTIPVEGQTNAGYNRSRFTFEDGKITVNYDDFEQIEIKISISGYSDQCIVRLKKYPVSMRPLESSVILNAGSSYTIRALGTFELEDGSTEERYLTESEFNFTVTTESEPIISVPNEQRLTVCSLLKTSGKTKVTVTLNDRSGKSKGMNFKVEFNVVEIAKESFLRFENFDNFIETGDSIEVDANKLTANAKGEYELHYDALFVSEQGTFIEYDGGYRLSSSNNDYVSFDENNRIIKIKSAYDVELDVTVYTDLFALGDDGNYKAVQITFKVNFIAKTNP